MNQSTSDLRSHAISSETLRVSQDLNPDLTALETVALPVMLLTQWSCVLQD